MLLHDRTRRNLDSYLKRPSVGLAIIGQKGAGKEHIARNIAAELLGTENIENHPHVHVIDAKEIDSAIDSVRSLQKTLSLGVPNKDEVRRVVIISRFHALGHEAQNALLKTLEEPPEGTVFLLTIDRPDGVLSTIYSRVQQLQVLPVSLEAAKNYDLWPIEDVSKIHQMSGGAVGLLDGLANNNEDHALVRALAEAKRLLHMPRHVRIASVDTVTKNKEISTEELLEALLRLLEASMHLQINSPDQKNLPVAQKRVKLTLEALKDLRGGVGAKLVLTRLFFEL